MNSLKIIPYSYVPTKPPKERKPQVEKPTKHEIQIGTHELSVEANLNHLKGNNILSPQVSESIDRGNMSTTTNSGHPEAIEYDNHDSDINSCFGDLGPIFEECNHFNETQNTAFSTIAENDNLNTSREAAKALDHLTNPVIGFAVEKGSSVAPEPAEIGNPAINAVNISKQRQEDQCNLLNSPKSPILVQPLTYYDNNHTVSHNLMQGNEDDLTKCDNGKSIQINRSVAETTNTNHGGESDIELRHSSVWYRFGPSTSNISQDSNYIAQVSDASCEREFYNIIGKEDIDGEVHYLVDWTPTLIRGEILKEAKAQPLIDRFETRCQSQKAALGFEYNPPPHHQDFNENLPKKQQHKKIAIEKTRENNKNKYTQNRWE
ncbi:hypothetical protein EAF00_001530 [Botryotinia globosa]|nr:hypothetical protein EAF00_001530 [Botryotinia globosa]